MKLQELLQGKVNMEKAKLVRHNLTNPIVLANYKNGLLEFYQAVQSAGRFNNTETVISFLGTEGTNAVFQGCYQVGGCIPLKAVEKPDAFVDIDSGVDNAVFYELAKTNTLAELKDRLIIDWGKAAISWCQNGTTEKGNSGDSPRCYKIYL